MTTPTSRRRRILTERGMDLYQQTVQELKGKLRDAKEELDTFLSSSERSTKELSYLELLDKQVKFESLFKKYRDRYQHISEYLQRQNTDISNIDMYQLQSTEEHDQGKYQQMKANIVESIKVQRLDSVSVITTESKVSKRSKTSSSSGSIRTILAVKRAEAAAAKVKLEFAMKEAEIKKDQAELEVNQAIVNAEKIRKQKLFENELNILKSKELAEVCAAEADALENETLSQSDIDEKLNIKQISKEENMDRFFKSFQPQQQQQHLDVQAPEFVPSRPENTENNLISFSDSRVNMQNQTKVESQMELSKFLVKRELLTSRLGLFNNRPENFGSWSASFQSVMKDLDVTSMEEVDLLVKHLTGESKQHAESLRSVYQSNPDEGRKQIWCRLAERFGAPELVKSSIMKKLANIHKINPKEPKQYYFLADILSEILALKSDTKYITQLSYFDCSEGIIPITQKLPLGIQEKWANRASAYKIANNDVFPPFSVFVKFIKEVAKMKNDPSLMTSQVSVPIGEKVISSNGRNSSSNTRGSCYKAEVGRISNQSVVDSEITCPIHMTVHHDLADCRLFKSMSVVERRKLVKEHDFCFKCLNTNSHTSADCKTQVKCNKCGSSKHLMLVHVDRHFRSGANADGKGPQADGGERSDHRTQRQGDKDKNPDGGERAPTAEGKVGTHCTQICGNVKVNGKSCAKIVLVDVYSKHNDSNRVRTYAILDEQSNRSLASPELFRKLNPTTEQIQYTLNTCAGPSEVVGQKAMYCVIEAADGSSKYNLPPLLECSSIPNVRDEIPTPEIASHFSHLQDVAPFIPSLDQDAQILLLIGRDLGAAHHVIEQVVGPDNGPFAQRLSLGWVVIGQVCLGQMHLNDNVSCNKTVLLQNGRPSHFQPCSNKFIVSEQGPHEDLFVKTASDDRLGLSVEDKVFLNVMDKEMVKDPSGNWIAPLPFKPQRPRLPNNRAYALNRATLLHSSLSKNPRKKEHFVTFMDQIIGRGHAEIAPQINETKERWYLPLFGVYHNKKPDQIRGVFDASSRYQGISLNDVLLQGPDLLNGLLGILMRFRKDDVAISADIQQMFYAFRVEEKDRDFLRFFWYKDNNPDENLIEYRMKVHVFGNRPSPAVANLGLLKTAEASEHKFGKDVKDFVSSNFYVDDGLTSLPTPEKAIDLMKRTQAALKEYGQLRLHKVASNSQKVMTAFPAEDLAKDLASLDLTEDDLPLQRSLGLTWNLQKDFFTFDVSTEPKPFTRRGVLSTINSLYDPIGFVSPVTIVGKCLLKEMTTSNIGWDEPLSSRYLSRWKDWTESLKSLQLLEIPRTYFSHSLSLSSQVDLYVFSDASEKAVASVAYLVSMHPNSMYETSFVMGKAKVAPSKGHTIPRLELCAAVLSTQITDFIVEHIGVKLQSVRFFTDSKVVLGYICNRTRRFYTYVSNRVERILSSSQASQWSYVDTGANPADVGSRGVDGNMLSATTWIKGPSPEVILSLKPSDEYVMQDPDTDKEVRPEIVTMTTKVSSQNIVPFGSHRFEKFSSFSRLVRAIGCLQHVSDSFARRTCSDSGWHLCPKNASRQHFSRAESFVVKAVQYEWYKDEITCLKQGSPVPRNSPLLNMRPILDIQGVLRVGGRLGNSDLPTDDKNPMIIPGKSHLALLLVRHFHEKVLHQGRHFTEGAVRSGGYWITGGKRKISSVLIECYQCRRLRGKMQTQLMADLPASRINQALPFTYVGIDAFGPWSIVTRRTRGGQASNKRWAILFTCLSIRAVHIEIVEEMSASAFINALRRFIAIRGNVVEIRSDRGTNFRGSCEDLGIHAVNVEEGPVKNLLSEKNVSWVFNPPHASHMGGVWERMIGIVRNILDSMLLQHGQKNLTHDVLVTFMAEVCAIVNARPIVPVSSDSEVPEILSPSTLLTHKTEPPTSFNENLSLKDVYRSEWKRVQLLADQFWGRWKSEFLSLLQKRPKWATDKPNLKVGDVVLCRDKTVGRNQWPVALITETFPSKDTKVRSVRIKVLSDGKPVFYTRPVTELVLLVSGKE